MRDAIASVIGQTWRDWSMVVVDDGSTDSTARVVDSFPDPRISLIRQANAGVSAARNRGIAAGTSDACLFLDADDWLAPDALARLAATLADSPAAVASVGRYARLIQPRVETGSSLKSSWPGLLKSSWLGLHKSSWPGLHKSSWPGLSGPSMPARATTGGPDKPGHDAEKRITAAGVTRLAPPPACDNLLQRLLVRNQFPNGGHLLIRRAAIDRAGGFRAGLHYGEDWEYWTRLALLGDFVPAPGGDPVLFVRERPGSAYLHMATDPARFAAATDAVYGNPDIIRRFDADKLCRLRRLAEAETAWVIGRELIRHGSRRKGWRWLGKSLRESPTLKRVGLAGLSWAGIGPFRPYPARIAAETCQGVETSRDGVHQ